MTTINFSLKGVFGLCLISFATLATAQALQRTSNGLTIKSTSKLQPPQATLAKSMSQKTDVKLQRMRQEREIAQQMAMQRSILNLPDYKQRIPAKSTTNSRGDHVKSK